jgi:hypothetical protein
MNKIQYRLERIRAKQKLQNGEPDFMDFLMCHFTDSLFQNVDRKVELLKQGYRAVYSLRKLDDEVNSARHARLLGVRKWRKAKLQAPTGSLAARLEWSLNSKL